jgi:opacity protein-like surface antigen
MPPTELITTNKSHLKHFYMVAAAAAAVAAAAAAAAAVVVVVVVVLGSSIVLVVTTTTTSSKDFVGNFIPSLPVSEGSLIFVPLVSDIHMHQVYQTVSKILRGTTPVTDNINGTTQTLLNYHILFMAIAKF